MIKVENLSFSFGSHTVLQDVSFKVNRGESFGIVGSSGCGKTTLLNILTGLLRTAPGHVWVEGRPLESYTLKSLSCLQQMVFQDPYSSLHPKFRIETTISEIAKAHKIADWRPRMDALLRQVNLEPALATRFPHQLSGGQRQRAIIAAALFLEPKILYLDEPTSGLDVSVQAEILNLLKDIQEQRGLTMVLITHDPAISAFMCERHITLS